MAKTKTKRTRWSDSDKQIFETVFQKYLKDNVKPPTVTVIRKMVIKAGHEDFLDRHNENSLRTRFQNLQKKSKKSSRRSRDNEDEDLQLIVPQVISHFAHKINVFEEPTEDEIEEFIEDCSIDVGPTKILSIISEQIALKSKKAKRVRVQI